MRMEKPVVGNFKRSVQLSGLNMNFRVRQTWVKPGYASS